ncbi:MAG: hypothetical protein MJA84_07010 [Firmicutes bacterium]|nr:hypothetical protein [Bacillota bacterium]
MMTTVTTTTTTTAAATTTASGSALVAEIGLMAVISLIIMLIVKELAGAAVTSGGELQVGSSLAALDRVISIAIAPLLFVFAFIVVQRVLMILM